MKILSLLSSKNTFIELVVLLVLYFLLNKIIFLLLISLLIYLIYKSNKPSDISLPKELENKQMKAFMENIDSSSKLIKDKFCFQDKVNIPHIKSDSDILVKIYSTSLNHIDTVFFFSRIIFVRWFRFSHFGVASDFSGKVIQIGKKIKKFKVGEKFLALLKEELYKNMD